MDRKKKDELPKMQVGFINFICMPVYTVSIMGNCEKLHNLNSIHVFYKPQPLFTSIDKDQIKFEKKLFK